MTYHHLEGCGAYASHIEPCGERGCVNLLLELRAERMAETFAALHVDENYLSMLGRFFEADGEKAPRDDEEWGLLFEGERMDSGRCIMRESPTEIGNAEAAVEVGEPRGAAPRADAVAELKGCETGISLPEAGHHAGEDGAGHGGTTCGDDVALWVDAGDTLPEGEHVGLDAVVGGRAVRAEVCRSAIGCGGAYGEHIGSVGGGVEVLWNAEAVVACRIDNKDAAGDGDVSGAGDGGSATIEVGKGVAGDSVGKIEVA